MPRPARAKPPAKKAPFIDQDLSLCVLEAMVRQGLVTTDIKIPVLAPEDEEDLEDESESWRDRVGNNQTEPIKALLQVLGEHRDGIAQVKMVDGLLIGICSDPDYEPSFLSLAGIEACVALERIEICTDDPGLDLSPLVSLPALAEVDLRGADHLSNLQPLHEIRALKRVVGAVDAATAAKLRQNKVKLAKR